MGEAKSMLVRGRTWTFTAAVRDEDQGELQYTWGHSLGACGNGAGPPVGEPRQGPSNENQFTFVAETLGAHCVWVMVEDRWGAQDWASTTITVANQEPHATVAVVSPTVNSALPLGSHVVVRTLVDDGDEDDVSATLKVLSPRGEEVMTAPCGVSGDLRCFRAMTPGVWTITAVADDGAGATTTSLPLQVTVDEDRPPCLEGSPASTLLVQDASEPLSLEVRAIDDLDSVPSPEGETSMASFRWRVWNETAGDWLTVLDQVGRAFRIPAHRFRPADSVRIRVEVSDRVPRPDVMAACPLALDECSTAPACRQRMTWKVEFR